MKRSIVSFFIRKNFLRPLPQAIVWGTTVLIFLGIADQLSMFYGLRESQRVVDDLFGGFIAGMLVYWYERGRSRYITEKLKTIELMNHHVRNALQVITYSTYVEAQARPINEIRDAVNRIDWALREILPGASDAEPGA